MVLVIDIVTSNPFHVDQWLSLRHDKSIPILKKVTKKDIKHKNEALVAL